MDRTDRIRPRRSVLFVPGDNDRALQRATQVAADCLIFDLEDTVLPDAKDAARARITEVLKTDQYRGFERIVRVNTLTSPWGYDDLAALAATPPDAIMLPSVEGPQDIHEALNALASAGEELALMAMIETPMGIIQAANIAGASPRLVALVLGTSDLASNLRCGQPQDRLPLLVPMTTAILAARCHNLDVIDGPHMNLHDAEGLQATCRQSAELGFDGKTLIHPRQIEAANLAFSIS
ncbi:MAG: CoA ester lyase, partial [Gammaproteobacteria bacterium]|nr:CoA ester lyase [Gammaproteobacteria bacterium]